MRASAPARLPGLRHLDHVALTVPDIDAAVSFFTNVLGAHELYRSVRGPDAQFMPRNFDVPKDASLELCMLRLPPTTNVELFQWSGTGRNLVPPRHCDAGGHHLCFVVDDVDEACAYLRSVEGVRVLGDVKQVGEDSSIVRGTRWTYFVTPWGLLIEVVDRSRVNTPPSFVGPG